MTGVGFLAKLREGLSKTKNAIWGRIDALLKAFTAGTVQNRIRVADFE